MNNSIGQFKVENNSSVFKISKSHTSKGLFDILTSTALGLACLFIVIFLIKNRLFIDFNWFHLFLTLVFSFVAYFKLSHTFSMLLEPTSNIVFFNKKTEIVYFRLTQIKKLKFKQSELKSIEYHIHKEMINIDDHQWKNRFWVEIEILTKSNDRFLIINLNPRRIIDKNTEAELLETSKNVVKLLSNELEIKKIWKGQVNENNSKKWYKFNFVDH